MSTPTGWGYFFSFENIKYPPSKKVGYFVQGCHLSKRPIFIGSNKMEIRDLLRTRKGEIERVGKWEQENGIQVAGCKLWNLEFEIWNLSYGLRVSGYRLRVTG